MSEAKHTETPWVNGLDLPHVANNDPDERLIWSGTMLIASTKTQWLSGEVQIANAEFIVRACNSHHQLLAACKQFVIAMRREDSPDMLLLVEALHAADAAIQKANE